MANFAPPLSYSGFDSAAAERHTHRVFDVKLRGFVLEQP